MTPPQSARGLGKVRCWCAGVLCAVMLLTGCSRETAQAPLPGEDLTFSSADGVRIAATYYPPRAPHAPALLLTPMLGAKRDSWAAFALRAQRSGYACLALDLRGHGASVSKNGEPLSYRSFSKQDWRDAAQDLDAAKRTLIARGAPADGVVTIGADIGASLSLHYAAANSDIAAVVMISPAMECKGIDAAAEIAAYGKRPILLIGAEQDAYAAQTCLTLKQIAPGLCELRQYPGSAHGTGLLDTSVNATEQILLWLRTIVPVAKP